MSKARRPVGDWSLRWSLRHLQSLQGVAVETNKFHFSGDFLEIFKLSFSLHVVSSSCGDVAPSTTLQWPIEDVFATSCFVRAFRMWKPWRRPPCLKYVSVSVVKKKLLYCSVCLECFILATRTLCWGKCLYSWSWSTSRKSTWAHRFCYYSFLTQFTCISHFWGCVYSTCLCHEVCVFKSIFTWLILIISVVKLLQKHIFAKC